MGILQTPEVVLSKATASDIPALVEILATSYVSEAICQFYFLDWPSTKTLRLIFQERMEKKFQETASEIFKLTSSETNKIVGCICLTLDAGDGQHAWQPTDPESDFTPPPGVNLEFAMSLAKEIARLDELMFGKKHLLLTAFAVDPLYQGRGLGSMLLRMCSEKADEQGLPLYLTALPGAYSLYVKHQFEVIDTVDVNLNEWGKKFRGYGLYRNYGMLREPVGKH